MRVLWIVTLAACGRFEFDPAPPDAMRDDVTGACSSAVGHDEDGDGVDDGCDGCPHQFTADAADRDGDGVGDACDPEPDAPRQRVAFFDGFVGGARAEWDFPGNVNPTFVTADGRDSLRASTLTDFFMMRRAVAPADDVYVVGGRITAVAPGDRQITIQPEAGGGPAYYCELLTSATTGKLAFTYTFDGTTYNSAMELPIQPLEIGAFTLTMRHDPPNVTCETSWPPQPALSAQIPMGLPAIQHSMFINGVEIELDYFVQIRSD